MTSLEYWDQLKSHESSRRMFFSSGLGQPKLKRLLAHRIQPSGLGSRLQFQIEPHLLAISGNSDSRVGSLYHSSCVASLPSHAWPSHCTGFVVYI